MWSLLTVTIFAVVHSTHVSNNTDFNSDVIVTYSGHSEVNPEIPIPDTDTHKIIPTTTVLYENTEGGSVVFIPNDRMVDRAVTYGDSDIGDLMKSSVLSETEKPSGDFLFISGKNTENQEKPNPKHKIKEMRRTGNEKRPLDCPNLDCNNTLKIVCGVKMDNGNRRYRVFLNECYFRKVNCAFKYDVNRYIVKPNQFCKTIGAHVKADRRFVYNPRLPILVGETTTASDVIKRRFSSRRSLNIKIDGSFCSHACPSSCPDVYDPECAMTSKGQHKVFVNHCKLDYDSCLHGTVWHKRPLPECVGSEKADLKQNRAFIGWMQRIGIVDGKGKLVMD